MVFSHYVSTLKFLFWNIFTLKKLLATVVFYCIADIFRTLHTGYMCLMFDMCISNISHLLWL